MKRIVVTLIAALVLVASASAGGPIKGKVLGVFVRGTYDGTLDQAGVALA